MSAGDSGEQLGDSSTDKVDTLVPYLFTLLPATI